MEDVSAEATEMKMKPEATPFFVVGIGASAGGLESLEKFFDNVPEKPGVAFAIIQHLSPDFKSMMNELLARHTEIAIHAAEEGMRVLPNNIYLLPPTKEMIISGGLLHLTDKASGQGLTLPIDHFFRSLAQDCGQHAIAVILSGTGSDGSRGIVDVHNSGGLVLCEHPETATFDGMPISAQETGMVDVVLTSENMPSALMRHVASPHEAKLRLKPLDSEPLEGIEAVFDLLHREYKIDFSHYKPTTVSRRIERRLAMQSVESLEHYVERLREDDAELSSLYKDLLIGVTQFFRDADPFLLLEREVIPELLESVPKGEEIRVWSAGCATGEEPYSIAILLHEALENAGRPIDVKIFATDVHQRSLEFAGLGLYDDERLSEVSAGRLKRYFTKKQSGYQISSELRQMIVFAQHNVIKDAPFTNLDLITCRNLLIYFQRPAQQKVMSLFHFGLKTGRTMLLGSSESPGELADEFETLDEHCKLYRKRRDIRLPHDIRLPLSTGAHASGHQGVGLTARTGPVIHPTINQTYERLLNRFMPPSILVNDQRELIESFGGAENLLKMTARPTKDVLDFLVTEERTSIAGALNRVIQHGKPLSFTGVKLETSEGQQVFRIQIQAVHESRLDDKEYLISFEPLKAVTQSVSDLNSDVGMDEMSKSQFRHLEEELQYSKENLQASIEELESSNEELQATNEEMVASNEELQSTNEELHSVNEELYTVNAEHQRKITEMAELNQDMEHLLQSTDVATVFLDRDLRIRKFTPKIAESFDLMDQDIGRRITMFSHRIHHDSLDQELKQVIESGKPREVEVRDTEGRCFFLRMLPYRTAEFIQGAVLSLIDITVLEAARSRISQLSTIVESSDDAIISKDLDGTIQSWNKGAERLYGYTAEQAIGQNISLIVQDDAISKVYSWFSKLRNGETIAPVQVYRKHRNGNLVPVSMFVSPVRDAAGKVIGASTTAQDMTELQKVRDDKDLSDQRIRLLLESTAEAIYGLDNDGKCTFVNPSCVKLLGYDSADELLGQHMHTLIHHTRPDGTAYEADDCGIDTAFRDGRRVHMPEEVFCRKDNSQFDVELWAHPMIVNGRPIGAVVTFLDTTERTEAANELKMEIRRREHFLAMLSHELRNPLSAVRTASQVLDTEGITTEMDLQSRHVIERQTKQMTRLLDDLLDVSRITENKIRMEMEVCDLREVVDDAIQSVQVLLDNNEMDFEVVVPNEPLLVLGDAARLQQVQTNLLTNAIKYSHTGGQVKLVLRREMGQAVIRVIDHGAGIASDLLDKVFNLFVQSDETLGQSCGGMGVGLTLVREIVKMHGGEVKASSAGVDTGSEFTVVLPLAKIPMAEDEQSDTNLEKTKIETVLIIEDQEDNRKMLTSLLEMNGFTMLGAADGMSGVQMAINEQPDAAVIDIGLPDIDGYQVARQIRAGESDQPMLLIALTGFGQADDVKRAMDAGFDHHLVKPLVPEALYSLLESDSDGDK